MAAREFGAMDEDSGIARRDGDDSPSASTAARRPGRPRSGRAQKAILDAVARLLRTRGLQGLTVDAVVADANVSKGTVYRWWGSKQTVAMDAILQIFNEELKMPDTGILADDLRSLMTQFSTVLQTGGLGYIYVSLLVEAQQNARIEEFHQRFFSRRRVLLHRIIRRGIARGELAGGTDTDLVADALFGPIIFRMLTGINKVDDAMIEDLLGSVLRGMRQEDRPLALS
jgi:AcrR family transcriptional regulator